MQMETLAVQNKEYRLALWNLNLLNEKKRKKKDWYD